MFMPFASAAEMAKWFQLNSVCLKEHLSISMQVTFLAFFVTHLALKWFGVLRNRGANDVVEQDDLKKHSITVKQSFSYNISLLCSVSILGTHCFLLLLLFLDSLRSRCDSSVSLFSAEISQAFSWLIVSLSVMKMRERKLVKFPWMLRLWWLSSFIFSFAFEARFITAKHEPFGFQDYADFTGLIASLFLLAVSIRGKTGFRLLDSNGIKEPLLLGSEAEQSKKDSSSSSPYGNANLFQRITFSWISPLFSLGYKRPLGKDDVPEIDVKDSARFCSQAFDQNMKTTIEKEGLGNAFFYKSVLRYVWKKAAINGVFAVINASTAYIGPYLINDFVEFLTVKQEKGLNYGYLLVLGFLGAKIVETVTQRQWIFGARQLGLRLRAALISHIYQKGLLLSSQSRQSHTSGEIINYMSVDVQRITDFIWYVNTIWMLPIQVFSAIYILQKHLGLGALAALATTFMVMACNYPLTRIQRNYQSDIMNAKDERMKATSEILKNMKILKLQAWDNQFLNKVKRLRKNEYDCLWRSLRLQAFTTFILWGAPALISVVTFVTCMLIGVKLTAGAVLSALATFQMLQSPIFGLPDLLSALVQSKVSSDRIASYLQLSESQKDAVEYTSKDHTDFSIEIENGSFSWGPEPSRPTLDEIQLKVKRGMKVAICGAVGTGKSSLLSSILGEIQKVRGNVRVSGKQAYVPQSPWILSGTIRDNILFGSIYESEKYEKTVKACALIKDFELFSNGDLTEIGERGINMSGGQKQRIQIARAVYQDADIYLLDDPFSAVDAHTGRQLFEECLMGILKEKTVLYVTHQVEFLPAADLILVMQNGRVMQAGKFEELLKQNIGFEVLVGAHNEALDSILSIEKSSRNFKDEESKDDTVSIAESLQTQRDSEHNISTENKKKEAKLVQDEETEKGVIGKEVYLAYLTTVKGGLLVPLIILAQSCFQMLQIASNYWMAWTAPPTAESEPKLRMDRILLVYALLAAGSSLCVLARTILVAIGGLLTAEKFFSRMLCSIFRAPMSFFDSTPTGRILNRASTDQSVLDLEMAIRLGWCAFSIIQIIGTIFVMSQVAWQVCVIFIPVAVACVFYQRYYTPAARELSRMSGVERAPILHHFGESLAGATTIRAFDQRHRFISSNLILIDNHSRPWFHVISAMEWLSFRLNLLSHFVFAFSLVLLVTLPEGVINPSIAGLGVTYGLSLNVLQATVIWNICNAENKMISVERILQYSKIPSEAPLVIDDHRPLDNWPNAGSIVFKDLQVRYAEHFPAVLKNITCEFPGGKKIGVVGRTGSGKSTLIQALFRIVEPSQGTIIIDDVDITKIGLHDLRSRLGIIPQDPALFDGTIRVNLDPLAQYTDREIWEALDKCQLGEVLRAKDEKLDATVVENGENWSVGQRQLVCLGRVLLKKSNILVLDEATASVDSATDGVIQKIISQAFKDRTVVTIAHRIHTVIESDLVLVLSDGRIAEFDSPAKLLEREDSFFSKLIKEYSTRSKNFPGSSNLLS